MCLINLKKHLIEVQSPSGQLKPWNKLFNEIKIHISFKSKWFQIKYGHLYYISESSGIAIRTKLYPHRLAKHRIYLFRLRFFERCYIEKLSLIRIRIPNSQTQLCIKSTLYARKASQCSRHTLSLDLKYSFISLDIETTCFPVYVYGFQFIFSYRYFLLPCCNIVNRHHRIPQQSHFNLFG